jgi:hypothetical protein
MSTNGVSTIFGPIYWVIKAFTDKYAPNGTIDGLCSQKYNVEQAKLKFQNT